MVKKSWSPEVRLLKSIYIKNWLNSPANNKVYSSFTADFFFEFVQILQFVIKLIWASLWSWRYTMGGSKPKISNLRSQNPHRESFKLPSTFYVKRDQKRSWGKREGVCRISRPKKHLTSKSVKNQLDYSDLKHPRSIYIIFFNLVLFVYKLLITWMTNLEVSWIFRSGWSRRQKFISKGIKQLLLSL